VLTSDMEYLLQFYVPNIVYVDLHNTPNTVAIAV